MDAHLLDLVVCGVNGATLGGFGGLVSLYQAWLNTKTYMPVKQACIELGISMVMGILFFGLTNYAIVEFFSHKPDFFLAALISCFGGWLGKRMFQILEHLVNALIDRPRY